MENKHEMFIALKMFIMGPDIRFKIQIVQSTNQLMKSRATNMNVLSGMKAPGQR